MTKHSFHPSILRKYDIRGVVNKTLTEKDAYFIGKAICKFFEKENLMNVAVAYDGRLSSPILKNSLIKGLVGSGLNVIDVGVGPSPMLYYAVHHFRCDFGIMVTGSHNPSDYNGFKICLKNGKPFYGKDIKQLSNIVNKGEFINRTGKIKITNIKDDYIKRLLNDSDLYSDSGFLDEIDDFLDDKNNTPRIAWDAGNGSAGSIMKTISEKIKSKDFLLFDDIDGNFPNHHPDPTVEDNLADLKAAVINNNCDLGIAFDGDGDRIGVVDDEGEVIWSDQLMMLFVQDILKEHPNATIISDVKASDNLFKFITNLGGKAIMSKTGHSYIKDKMKSTKALLAGEMSGHIFFADKYYGFDDALYAAIRLINIVFTKKISLSDFRKSLPKTFFTPEIKVFCTEEEKFNIIENIKNKLNQEKIKFVDIDGVRVSDEDSWWLIRASNTQPVLVVRCESESEEKLKIIKNIVSSILKHNNLKIPSDLIQ